MNRSNWHTETVEAVCQDLSASPRHGLGHSEARRRLLETGPNKLGDGRHEPWWKEIIEELTEPMILLLLAVGVVYAIMGELKDAIAIFLIILAVLSIEMANESRAKGAIAALRRMASPTSPLVRDGEPVNCLSEEVVPGDVVRLEPGERVPADLRLIETIGLSIDESSLTGESLPVTKSAVAVLPDDTELADRCNMAYSGTLIAAGRGLGVTVATGMNTELGRIAGMVAKAREPRTPLQMHMRQLSAWLVWVALGFSVAIPLLGWALGLPLRDMILTGLTLSFATIPEELPILITMVLGLGGYRLAKQHSVAKRLKAVETLGSITVIAADKTGTLTENRMTVATLSTSAGRIGPNEATGEIGRLLFETAVLANAASISAEGDKERFIGDPTETALLAAAMTSGMSPLALRRSAEMVAEHPFTDDRKLMSAVHRRNGQLMVSAKGAPEALLAVCDYQRLPYGDSLLSDESRRGILAEVSQMAAEGLRVLGFACRIADDALMTRENAETHLVFLGLMGLADPLRPESTGAVSLLKSAGIRVVMMTGDHVDTARAIAQKLGIQAQNVVTGRDLGAAGADDLRRLTEEASLFARIAPEHKLTVVRSLQEQGEVVAVTGDGVNDAPALKEAAVGVAMGLRGTDVAKEAADIVLTDDNFATIARAVAEGRRLYTNLRKAVRYYLAAKVALVLSSLAAVLAGLPLPFAPIQIIITELFMDMGASVTFTTEPAESDVMLQAPRDPRNPFMDRSMQTGVFSGGISLALAVTASYLYGWHLAGGVALAQTIAFFTWMIGHLVLALLMRTEREPVLRLGVFTNRAFLGWAGAAILFVVAAMTIPGAGPVFRLAPLQATDWIVIMALSLLAPSWMELAKWLRWRRSSRIAPEAAQGQYLPDGDDSSTN